MSLDDRRRALDEALRGNPTAAKRSDEFVATLRHDLGNLFGTFTMEAHLLGHVVLLLDRAVASGDLEGVRRQIAELKMTTENLGEAGERARAFLTSLAPPSGEVL